MTVTAYRRLGNISFGVAIAAVLSFDSFHNQLIPGAVLVSSGVFALAINTFARFRPLQPDSGRVAVEGPTRTPAQDESATAIDRLKKAPSSHDELVAELKRQSTPGIERIAMQRQQEIIRDYMAIVGAHSGAQQRSTEADDLASYLYIWRHSRYQSRARFIRTTSRYESTQNWNQLEAAVKMAQMLNPQPTEYDVSLASDGTLRISPKTRAVQDDPQTSPRTREVQSGDAVEQLGLNYHLGADLIQ